MTQTRIRMLVCNDCRTNHRVLKEASSLGRAHYPVAVAGVNTRTDRCSGRSATAGSGGC